MIDVTDLDMVGLQRYARGLQEALKPFADAGQRIKYYESSQAEHSLYAEHNNCLDELLADDPEVCDEVQGDCRPLIVEDLFVADLALKSKTYKEGES